jgi:hypothetical protein
MWSSFWTTTNVFGISEWFLPGPTWWRRDPRWSPQPDVCVDNQQGEKWRTFLFSPLLWLGNAKKLLCKWCTVIIRGGFIQLRWFKRDRWNRESCLVSSQAASLMGDVLNDAHLNDRFWFNASSVLIENRLFLDKGCKKKDFTRGYQHSPETKLGTSTVYPINRFVGCVHFPCENAILVYVLIISLQVSWTLTESECDHSSLIWSKWPQL